MKRRPSKREPARRRATAPGPVIRFGTDGWRGVIARDFTRENVELVARALARYLVEFEDLRRGVVVGYDTRFRAGDFARQVAAVLTSVGVEVRLAAAPTPTPALSFAVRHFNAAAGVILTASHNPPDWLGIKLKAAYGGSASPRAVREVERFLAEPARRGGLPRVAPSPRLIEVVDFKPAYLARLAELADLDAIARARLRLAVDSMHGAGAGYLRELLSSRGVEVVEVRGTHDPLFGGTQPEPIEANLGPLREAVERDACAAGFAADGDADR
ncbi:MAG: phosphoglucomutase/phosphomannomutase family protein, partial [Candidatus Acidiferrales bacterium]